MVTLMTKHLDCYIEGYPILKDLNIEVNNGEFVGILGPNGCGKSTLINHIAKILPIHSGDVLLNQKSIQNYSHKSFAQIVSVVNQNQSVPFEFKVHEVVEMGRFPHKKLMERDNIHDKEIIEQSLSSMGMLECYYDNFYHLSGGQQQRVLIAKALAQETEMIILDEPTNHLDIEYQIHVFNVLKQLGVTVLTALHDLNIAAMYCDRAYVLKDHCCQKKGDPKKILDETLLQQIFGVSTHVYQNPFAISYKTKNIVK